MISRDKNEGAYRSGEGGREGGREKACLVTPGSESSLEREKEKEKVRT